MDELRSTIHDAIKDAKILGEKSNTGFVCQYCNRSFHRETTMFKHVCEKKRRYQQKNDKGVQLGLQAFMRFFEMVEGSAKRKTYTDFVESKFYNAFVKFGRQLRDMRCVNTKVYIDYVIENNIKLDDWSKESIYRTFLYTYLRNENPADAIERSIIETDRWATKNDTHFDKIFLYGNKNEVCVMISNGRISPWLIFHCDSGVEFLSSLNEDQLSLIYRWIDPDFWQKKFVDNLADTEMIKSVMKNSNL